MGPTWGPPGSCRPPMGPMLAPWTLLSGLAHVQYWTSHEPMTDYGTLRNKFEWNLKYRHFHRKCRQQNIMCSQRSNKLHGYHLLRGNVQTFAHLHSLNSCIDIFGRLVRERTAYIHSLQNDCPSNRTNSFLSHFQLKQYSVTHVILPSRNGWGYQIVVSVITLKCISS